MSTKSELLKSDVTVERNPGIWRTLSGVLVTVNVLFYVAKLILGPDTVEAQAQALGTLLGLVIFPLLIVVLFSIAHNFRNATSRWKIFFWAYAVVLISQLPISDESLPYTIEWPDDWQVSHGSLPLSASGSQFDGARVTATRMVADSPAAVIELNHMRLRWGVDESSLDEFYGRMLEKLTAGPEDDGLSLSVNRSTGSLAGLSSIEAQVTAIGESVIIQQSITIVANEEYIFVIALSGLKPRFEQYWGDYQKVLASFNII